MFTSPDVIYEFVATLGPVTQDHLDQLEPGLKEFDDGSLSARPKQAARQLLSGLVGAGFDIDELYHVEQDGKIGQTIKLSATSIYTPELDEECDRMLRRGAERMGLGLKMDRIDNPVHRS